MPLYRSYNRDFFKKWTADMAYVLGFLYADGNIVHSKRGNRYVAFYSADEGLMADMRAAFGSAHKIGARTSPSGQCFCLQIGSKEWFDDLGKIGLIPNKTRRMRLPDVPPEFMGDYIRGYFDGDGNVWAGMSHKERKKSCSLLVAAFTSCSIDFLRDLLFIMHTRGIRGGNIYTPSSGTYSRLSLSTLDALKLYRIMYNSPCSLRLERKKAVFDKFLRTRTIDNVPVV